MAGGVPSRHLASGSVEWTYFLYFCELARAKKEKTMKKI